LLIKGANTQIRDIKGNLPFDYIKDIDNIELSRELINLLQENKSACHMIYGTTPI
jgi:hypothetical protein